MLKVEYGLYNDWDVGNCRLPCISSFWNVNDEPRQYLSPTHVVSFQV